MNSGWEQSVLHTFLLLCLTGAFSTLLEFVNSRNAAHCWLAECVIFVGEHALGTLKRDRQKESERDKKERERLIEGKRTEV